MHPHLLASAGHPPPLGECTAFWDGYLGVGFRRLFPKSVAPPRFIIYTICTIYKVECGFSFFSLAVPARVCLGAQVVDRGLAGEFSLYVCGRRVDDDGEFAELQSTYDEVQSLSIDVREASVQVSRQTLIPVTPNLNSCHTKP